MSRTAIAVSLSLVIAAGASAPAAAQGGAGIEIVAELLAAEDARSYDDALFRRALANPDSTVRRYAALAAGRIGDAAAVEVLGPLLADPDTTVQVNAIFALGLLGDSSAVPLLARRARDPAWLASAAAFELVTAAARIGGGGGAGLVRDVMRRSVFGDRSDSPFLGARAARESWRLGALAPVEDLLGMTQDIRIDPRLGAVYALARLQPAGAVPRLLDALGDRESPLVRAAAARGLSFRAVERSREDATAVADRLRRATGDADPGVRINALRALATFPQIPQGEKLVPLLDDVHANVQVQAAQALGFVPGPRVTEALFRVAESEKGSAGRRHEAFLALARQDTATFLRLAESWGAHADWRRRAAAAEGYGRFSGSRAAAMVGDRDPRVQARALSAWWQAVGVENPDLLAAARRLLSDADAGLRSVAAGILRAGGGETDLSGLVSAVKRAARDSFPDAVDSALTAIRDIAGRAADPAGVEQRALAQLPVPSSYVTRQWAEFYWPAASAHWGPAYPLDPERTMQDYREIAERFLSGSPEQRYPHVIMEVEQLGRVELVLFGAEAPLTVANFLRLVDRRYFDGQRFHRVVPNFVVQSGDPRGDGLGGPGPAIRDEINLRRYGAYVLGMALSGPNTGGSQWFITLSPQPYLDGGYTAFGEVTEGMLVLQRVTQGDQIRTIRRP